MTEVGSLEGGTTHSSTVMMCPLYLFIPTLYCVHVHDKPIDALKEQQLKQMQSGSSKLKQHNQGTAAEADVVREQQLKWTQPGHASV